eukprot:m.749898 g.749898  ORF g.749898 m.749898 type:complete len:74 (-) comp58978_c0_seq3:2081-2302(-)
MLRRSDLIKLGVTHRLLSASFVVSLNVFKPMKPSLPRHQRIQRGCQALLSELSLRWTPPSSQLQTIQLDLTDE